MDAFQAQSVPPDAVELYIPEEYNTRDLGIPDMSKIPSEFEVNVCDRDFGPATKVLPAAKKYRGQEIALIYCDDDRDYDREMISTLMSVFNIDTKTAAANEVVKVSRALLKAKYEQRKGTYRLLRACSLGIWDPKNKGGLANQLIAAGMGGVAIAPDWLKDEAFEIPDLFRPVDDVWLSGQLTANGVTISRAGQRRSGERVIHGRDVTLIDPLTRYEHDGMDRAAADAACVEYFQENKKIWIG